MFISINHILVKKGRESDFEKLFRERDRLVEKQLGFVSLDILKPTADSNEYQVLTRWLSKEDFKNWTSSEAFKKSHSRPTDHSIFDGKSFLTLHETIEGAGAS
ncbi:MAG: antibiotic biosynthesis monooxygenase [Candidatus Melainabacteria bacterium]|uniref:Antibiotic biosynthesis monooxygenase n=1 Tax=Candidatus Obscuribacter phosphatis TaxID=1906157 RepID=A0A8J7TPP5_9BACT|nr:antibiotic biosynthesis monooxygenase [Candidatus Obscuribacter phosphatis]MCA0314272.1 antibiotic biosynthesis monooxygenase [Candidatus Melainabacteria bacterium]OPZ86055.1 MAG: Heme-degrading monooxygenase HmoB [bacterium ADurb.Bin425]